MRKIIPRWARLQNQQKEGAALLGPDLRFCLPQHGYAAICLREKFQRQKPDNELRNSGAQKKKATKESLKLSQKAKKIINPVRIEEIRIRLWPASSNDLGELSGAINDNTTDNKGASRKFGFWEFA